MNSEEKRRKGQNLSPPKSFFSSFSTGEKNIHILKNVHKKDKKLSCGILAFHNERIPRV